MHYESTRGASPPVTSRQAILRGLAPDGGLYVPDTFPKQMPVTGLSYSQLAAKLTHPFLPEYDEQALIADYETAYRHFDDPRVAPLKPIRDGLYALELWHGPTMAFKDMALQILPALLCRAMKAEGMESEVVILVATSGDTGKAALAGFADVPNTRCVVFYPKAGVSRVQELQMLTQTGKNVAVIGVTGNFDDAQNGVKTIFSDRAFSLKSKVLSSANSINWGRLVPQIAYYYSAFADLMDMGHPMDEPVNFVVPTGNFGNILAAYMAKQMGLPIHKLICASNNNHVLTDFIRTGIYNRNRQLHITQSPSMDILVSSNLERYLYWKSKRDTDKVSRWMNDLKNTGRYDIGSIDSQQELYGGWASDIDGQRAIASLFRDFGYLSDPHTAVGYAVYEQYAAKTGDDTKTILVSTASPYKFGHDVAKALFSDDPAISVPDDAFECCRMIEYFTDLPMPQSLCELQTAAILHHTVCAPSDMANTLFELLTEYEAY